MYRSTSSVKDGMHGIARSMHVILYNVPYIQLHEDVGILLEVSIIDVAIYSMFNSEKLLYKETKSTS